MGQQDEALTPGTAVAVVDPVTREVVEWKAVVWLDVGEAAAWA